MGNTMVEQPFSEVILHKQNLPQHIAVIMDGNGRWARHRGLPHKEGHRQGAEALKNLVKASAEYCIKYLTVFAFSSENWQRPEAEVNDLMQLFMNALHEEVSALNDNQVCLKFLGDRRPFTQALCEQMCSAERLTADNSRLQLNVALNYGGRWDIIHAVQQIAQAVAKGHLQASDIDESTFQAFTQLAGCPDPDLLIRTGAEQRVSNFLLWHLSYTELYFSDIYWPDFDAMELQRALVFFASKERRYGRVSAQCSAVPV